MIRNAPILVPAAITLLLACPSFAGQTQVVMTSTSSPEELWKKVGDFCGIQSWHPVVQKCELSGDGRLRTLTVKGGDTLTSGVKNRAGWNGTPVEQGFHESGLG
ncbi:MAG: SRPBCC family protein [Hyphomicrobium sp.]